jgi:hypothetical protein
MARVLCVDGVEREDTPEQAARRLLKKHAVAHPDKFDHRGLPYARSSRRGAANQIGRKLREALFAANEIIGRESLQDSIHKGDVERLELCVNIAEAANQSPNLVAFFLELWRREPKTYGALVGRTMPLQITGADGGPINLMATSREQLVESYRKLGIPVPERLLRDEPKVIEGKVVGADSSDD